MIGDEKHSWYSKGRTTYWYILTGDIRTGNGIQDIIVLESENLNGHESHDELSNYFKIYKLWAVKQANERGRLTVLQWELGLH